MEKVEPPMSLKQQLNRTYRNLHPDYVDKIGRQQFTTFEELLVLGRNEEIKKEQRRLYKLPPHSDQSLLNDAAYRGRKPSNKAAPMQNNQFSQEEGRELAAIDQNKNQQTPHKSSKKNNNSPPPSPPFPKRTGIIRCA